MAKTVFALIFIILISAILQIPALAAEITKPSFKADPSGGFSVSSTVGGYFFAGSEQRNVTPLYGVKVGYENIERSFVESLGIEGTLNKFSSRPKNGVNNDTGYLFRLDAIYPFPINKKWMPFFAIGAGGIMIDSSTHTTRNYLLNYGVGVKYFIENYLAVRADVRHLGVYENVNMRNNFELSAGLSYYFGKERTKKVPTPLEPKKKEKVATENTLPKFEEIVKPTEADATDKAVAVAANQTALAVAEASTDQIVKDEVLKEATIEFDINSSSIEQGYFTLLKEIAEILKSSEDVKVHIDGHTDGTGILAVNMALSEQRALSVQGGLISSGVNPKQLSISAYGPAKPIADNTTVDGRQKNRRAEIQVIKIDPAAFLKAQQELQNESDRIENARLEAEILAKSGIKAAMTLQEVSGALPVNSDNSLSFEMVNQGLNTDEYLVTITAPAELGAFLARANSPGEKVTLLRLAPGEKFKGNVLFRIPTGMVDGQKSTVSVKAVSTQYGDVFYQKEITIVCSAPLVQVVAKLSRQEVAPGEKLRYQLTILNAGSLSARNLTIKLQIPPQVELAADPDVPFIQEAPGMLTFKVDTIDSGKRAEIHVDLKLREDSTIGQELTWNVEVIEGKLQRRVKSTERGSVVRSK